MNNKLWDLLVEKLGPGTLEKRRPEFREKLRTLSDQLSSTLKVCDEAAGKEILTKLSDEIAGHLMDLERATMMEIYKWEPTPPEILEWARSQPIDEEEMMRGIREIEETGGCQLDDIIHELEQRIHPSK